MKRWVRIVLIVVLAAGLVVGLFGMLRRQTEDRKGAESYAEAAAIAGAELPAAESAAQTPAEEQETQDPYLQMFARMDVEALRQVNPEVLGWLWLPNTQISYPLMQGTDNEYYLHNTWKNEPNELGAIFLDYRSAPDFSDFNTLIYGHRMQSYAMFATLRFYAEQAHWESAPLVYVRAGDTVYTFTIFAAYEAPVTQPLYLPALTDAAQIDAVLQYAQEASVLDTGLAPGAEDHILTLVTCTGDGHASRWIVQGPEASHRLLRRAAALAAPQLTDCTLARQAQGKPWFPAAPELHFSISHSGGRWVCAFADAPVGLDLQAHRPCRALALARRFFTPEEAEWLRSRGEAAFFDLWCAKESWLKYTGRGLSALPEAIVLAPDGQFPARPDARLQLLPVFDGYSLCVCTKDAARVALREL